VRHALAEDREVFKKTGQPDSLRPLVPKGIKQMKLMTKTLKKLIGRVDAIATSPYKRAQDTAKILHKSFRRARLIELPELTPGCRPEKTLRELQAMSRAEVVMIVGHEPHLSRFLSFILTGSSRPIFDIKKGAVALVEFKNRIERKQAQLQCLLQPSQLKKIKTK